LLKLFRIHQDKNFFFWLFAGIAFSPKPIAGDGGSCCLRNSPTACGPKTE
jgi:hypothetical protein